MQGGRKKGGHFVSFGLGEPLGIDLLFLIRPEPPGANGLPVGADRLMGFVLDDDSPSVPVTLGTFAIPGDRVLAGFAIAAVLRTAIAPSRPLVQKTGGESPAE